MDSDSESSHASEKAYDVPSTQLSPGYSSPRNFHATSLGATRLCSTSLLSQPAPLRDRESQRDLSPDASEAAHTVSSSASASEPTRGTKSSCGACSQSAVESATATLPPPSLLSLSSTSSSPSNYSPTNLHFTMPSAGPAITSQSADAQSSDRESKPQLASEPQLLGSKTVTSGLYEFASPAAAAQAHSGKAEMALGGNLTRAGVHPGALDDNQLQQHQHQQVKQGTRVGINDVQEAKMQSSDDLGSPGSYTQHQVAEECLEPWRYICKTPGKNVRSKMIDCFQEWLRIPEERLPLIKQIVGSLHNASLLIDDIEDDSKLRRGHPVAHMVYGVPQTLNCANYVYFMAMEKCLALQNPSALHVFTLELLNLHRGQGRELLWRDNCRCPTEEEYLSMIMDKTGGLFRLGVGLMQSFSENNTNFSKLVNLLSIYFQVRDDFINLASSTYHRNKSFCEDLTEGKFSFPIIHGVRHAVPGDNYLLSILKQRTENVDLKRSFVEYLRTETRSFEYTKAYLDTVFHDIEEEISAVGGSQHLMTLMEKLREEVDECEI